jgi:glycosyltransferase involved in cell wall biosynthesis
MEEAAGSQSGVNAGRALVARASATSDRALPAIVPSRIAPDTFSRNLWIRRVCEALVPPGVRFTALDVGGSGGMLAEFLGDVRVVDLRAGADVHVVADGRRLPFPDRAFDVVTCLDVLEHVPESDREALLDELLRTARCAVVVAGPYRSPEVEAAEQALREFHRYCTNGISHHWLDEHMRYGLPSLAWLEDRLRGSGRAFHRLRSNNVQNWLLFQLLIFLNMFDLDAHVADFFEDYNRNLEAYRDGHGVAYRYIHVVPASDEARGALEALEAQNAAGGGTDDEPMPPPVLVAKAFAAIAEAMAVKNIRTEAAIASATRSALLLGEGRSAEVGIEQRRPSLEEALARCSELEERLRTAHEQLDGHESYIHRQHREIADMRAILDSVLTSKSWKMTAPLRTFVESARQLSDVPRRLAGRQPRLRQAAGGGEVHKAVLFLSGCPGDAKRYRCDHQVEQLRLLGVTADAGIHGEVDLNWALRSYGYFVLHRVPFGADVDYFLRGARRLRKQVVFETDDWVFDVASMPYVAALEDMRVDERALYREGLERYRATLKRCDAALVSTEPLAQRAAELVRRVVVHPNVASREMVRLAERARVIRSVRRASQRPAGEVVLAYLSGTPTHRRDFAEVESAILWLMERYPGVRLLTVGHIDVRDTFGRFGARHSHLPLMPWQHLFEVMAEVDVNLAPLERRNPFTECKSSIKFLEAALVGVPTIATSLSDFQRVIESERNGCLVDSREAWRDGLRRLVESPDLRETLGARALDDALANHTTSSAAPTLVEKLKTMRVHDVADRPLTINWVVRAPIAGTGGGYWTIFRLANALGAAGHHVRVYVEPIAHLEGLSDGEIQAFLEKNFGPLAVQTIVGHERILPADVSIATNWPTAYTVADLQTSAFKMYFVQDFEPEFYDVMDPLYRKAQATYDLPLQLVCIGRSLARRMEAVSRRPAAWIDFAVDGSVFHMTTDPAERRAPPRILFFARPSLPRRGYGLGVEALRRVKAERPDVRVAFFGATDAELADVGFDFENLGVVSHEELAREMNASHVLLCFSLSANISWVPLQGMACGCAVVDADVPGVREMVTDGETCRLAAADPASVAEAVLGLLGDDAERQRLGRAAAAEMARGGFAASMRQFERILVDRCFVRLERNVGAIGRAVRAHARAGARTNA